MSLHQIQSTQQHGSTIIPVQHMCTSTLSLRLASAVAGRRQRFAQRFEKCQGFIRLCFSVLLVQIVMLRLSKAGVRSHCKSWVSGVKISSCSSTAASLAVRRPLAASQ